MEHLHFLAGESSQLTLRKKNVGELLIGMKTNDFGQKCGR